MKLFLVLFLFCIFSAPCFAEHRNCGENQIVALDRNKALDQCRHYRSYKLKRPIVSRADKKYKNIVETFDKRRVVNKCSHSSTF